MAAELLGRLGDQRLQALRDLLADVIVAVGSEPLPQPSGDAAI